MHNHNPKKNLIDFVKVCDGSEHTLCISIYSLYTFYISALENVMKLILSNNVLLASLNTIYTIYHT